MIGNSVSRESVDNTQLIRLLLVDIRSLPLSIELYLNLIEDRSLFSTQQPSLTRLSPSYWSPGPFILSGYDNLLLAEAS